MNLGSLKQYLFRTKSIDKIIEESGQSTSLKRTLSSFNLVTLGIGAIIGAGIFSITGDAAAKYAGPAITISFMVAALGCVFAGLCYAEFASMLPVAGSAYTYSYATLGEFIAWIIGWDLILEYAVGAATVSISWSRYLSKLFHEMGIDFPMELMMSPFQTEMVNGVAVHGWINLPAVFITVLMSLLLIRGTKESAKFNNLIVILKVTIVLAVIILGWSYINEANFDPYIPAREYTPIEPDGKPVGRFGWTGIITGAGVVFFAFIGFDAVSTAAQEAKDPKKGMPIGILGSLVVCTILYVLFAHVLTGLENYKNFMGESAPVALAMDHTPYKFFKLGIIIAILAGYSSVIMVLLMGQSRVFFSMSKDGLVPSIFSDLHAKFKTPWKSNLLFALFVGLFAAFIPAHVVGEMCSIGTLFAFVLVCIGVIVLRKKQPDAPRSFRTPWVPVIPILGALTCFYMMYELPADTWWRLLIWMAVGVILYFVYSKRKSKLNV